MRMVRGRLGRGFGTRSWVSEQLSVSTAHARVRHFSASQEHTVVRWPLTVAVLVIKTLVMREDGVEETGRPLEEATAFLSR